MQGACFAVQTSGYYEILLQFETYLASIKNFLKFYNIMLDIHHEDLKFRELLKPSNKGVWNSYAPHLAR
jgi:hypothetical protein